MFDASGRVYASHVVAAYAYAQRMGAHIVSCSFGPDTPNLQPQPYEVAEMVAQESLYISAVTPLEEKGVLLVAAAGERGDRGGVASWCDGHGCGAPGVRVLVGGCGARRGLVL